MVYVPPGDGGGGTSLTQAHKVQHHYLEGIEGHAHAFHCMRSCSLAVVVGCGSGVGWVDAGDGITRVISDSKLEVP